MKLCSACLLGVRCRFDGKGKPNKKVLELSKKEILIPFCPEQLGGLPTPREASKIVNDEVMTLSGKNVTENFNRGAREVIEIAKLLKIKEAILKQESPSCGCGKIHDGTFSDILISGDGIATRLLKKNGIKVMSEEDL